MTMGQNGFVQLAALAASALVEQEMADSQLDLGQLHLLMGVEGALVFKVRAATCTHLRLDMVLLSRFQQCLTVARMPFPGSTAFGFLARICALGPDMPRIR